ncbi:hypothetical protein GGI12_006244 [Dipsacomyces acuminosporus]|nr:hypothetical protein GGI12_006244 [Dipsacomyces acuminosporus]
MQFTKVLVAIAAIACAVLGQDIDWRSPKTLACAKARWAEIKAKADPLIPAALGGALPADKVAKLKELLSGQTTLPANPAEDWIKQLPDAIPPTLLTSISGEIINSCLATYKDPAPAPTSSVPGPAPTTDAPAPTTGAPAPTTAAPAPTSASVPPKCIPKH